MYKICLSLLFFNIIVSPVGAAETTKPITKHADCSKFVGERKAMCEKHMQIADICYEHCKEKVGAAHHRCMRETFKKFSEEACKDKKDAEYSQCIKEHMEMPEAKSK